MKSSIPLYSKRAFGGLWESYIKSAKHHMKRIMGNSYLTYEEFKTLINQRPITAPTKDLTDLTSLTPVHFLVGCSITSYPESNLTSISQNKLKLWKMVYQKQQHF